MSTPHTELASPVSVGALHKITCLESSAVDAVSRQGSDRSFLRCSIGSAEVVPLSR